jgi:hypothetical protein
VRAVDWELKEMGQEVAVLAVPVVVLRRLRAVEVPLEVAPEVAAAELVMAKRVERRPSVPGSIPFHAAWTEPEGPSMAASL